MSKNIIEAKFSSLAYFKIPIGLDLYDEKIVKEWEVSWRGLLIIDYVDGRHEVIDPCGGDDDIYVDGVDILQAEDVGMEHHFEEDDSYSKRPPTPPLTTAEWGSPEWIEACGGLEEIRRVAEIHRRPTSA